MNAISLLRRQLLLATCYSLFAALAINFVHPNGVVALLWGSTALLLAALMRTAQRHWWAPVLACVVPSLAVTAALGWTFSFLLMLINALEAVTAAWLVRRKGDRGSDFASHGWLKAFVAAAVLAPLLVSPLVAAALVATGNPPFPNMAHYVAGHALGNLIFTPSALMLTGTRARRDTLGRLHREWKAALGVLGASLGLALLVFAQTAIPMLFLASLAVVVSTVRLGREGAAISIATLAIVGAAATGLGSGPVFLMPLSEPARLLMFQFFLAITVLTVLPVAAELEVRKALLRRVRDSEERFRLLAEHSSDILMQITEEGCFRYVSPSMLSIAGYDPAELTGRHCGWLIAPEHHDHVLAAHRQTIQAPGETVSYEFLGILGDGSRRWFEVHARAVVDEAGQTDGVLSIARDISHRKAIEQSLLTAAHSDLLTGLPNRRAFEELIARRIRLGRPGRDCLAVLDLDKFKSVNDTYGHDAGDAVLKGFAEVARRLVRTHDTVARLGGEEFVILFEDTSLEQAYQVCDRLRRVLGRTPLGTPAGPLRVTASGGVAVIGRAGLAAALKAADEALYRAKKGGRDQLLLAA